MHEPTAEPNSAFLPVIFPWRARFDCSLQAELMDKNDQVSYKLRSTAGRTERQASSCVPIS